MQVAMEVGDEGPPRQQAVLEGLKLLNMALEYDQPAAEQLNMFTGQGPAGTAAPPAGDSSKKAGSAAAVCAVQKTPQCNWRYSAPGWNHFHHAGSHNCIKCCMTSMIAEWAGHRQPAIDDGCTSSRSVCASA